MTFLVFFFSLITLAYSKCPSGTSTGLDGSNYCYKFYGASTGFFDAETKCTGINGHLASISSGFLNSFIASKSFQAVFYPRFSYISIPSPSPSTSPSHDTSPVTKPSPDPSLSPSPGLSPGPNHDPGSSPSSDPGPILVLS